MKSARAASSRPRSSISAGASTPCDGTYRHHACGTRPRDLARERSVEAREGVVTVAERVRDAREQHREGHALRPGRRVTARLDLGGEGARLGDASALRERERRLRHIERRIGAVAGEQGRRLGARSLGVAVLRLDPVRGVHGHEQVERDGRLGDERVALRERGLLALLRVGLGSGFVREGVVLSLRDRAVRALFDDHRGALDAHLAELPHASDAALIAGHVLRPSLRERLVVSREGRAACITGGRASSGHAPRTSLLHWSAGRR